MGATVFASASTDARTYHFDRDCLWYHSAQALSDVDCGCDTYCTHHAPRMHPLLRLSDHRATVDRRLWPCTFCVPSHLRRYPPSGTFGHEPSRVIDVGGSPVPACGRCRTYSKPTYFEVDGQHFTMTGIRPVRWPCTSAIVLGLEPRSEGTPA